MNTLTELMELDQKLIPLLLLYNSSFVCIVRLGMIRPLCELG